MLLLAAFATCLFRVDARSSANVDDAAPVSTSGTHGCIDCVIGPCHQCLCREALKRCSSGVANVLDIFNKAKNQYLVCEGNRITCHPCPKGLVWNCQKQVCDVVSDCPPIPAKCNCECGISDKIQKSFVMSTFTTTSVTTTANSETSTTVSYHPIHAPLPAPVAADTRFSTSTVEECFQMSNGGLVSIPCGRVDPMLSKLGVSLRNSGAAFPGSSSNTTTTTTTNPCSDSITTTKSASAVTSSCPAMTTTIAEHCDKPEADNIFFTLGAMAFGAAMASNG